jgi:diphosphomevalonate decarboxylase
LDFHAEVTSENNFPTAAGLASSSSAFAALALAAAAAAGQPIDRARLSVIARQGSGSACRSLWGGFVEWRMGARADGTDSHGVPVAPADHWDLRLVVAVVSAEKKAVGSTDGMTRTAQTCPLFPGFVSSAPADVDQARSAVLARDLPLLGAAMERSTNKMHATMIATEPTVRYWKPVSVAVLDAVEAMRADGLSCYSTMDAGPNVKVLCATADAERVAATLRAVPGLVRVEVDPPDQAGIVELRVIDTGVGFEPAVAERIFEPYRQAGPEIARRFGGTGLGLSISQIGRAHV